jgi:uncharacterized OB-fold protein
MKAEVGQQPEQKAVKKIPFKENLFVEQSELEGEPRMVGAHCQKCGRYSFPFREICIFCHSREVQKDYLSPRGKLHTFTICRLPVPNTTPPYAMGYIDLPERLMIFSQLTHWNEKELRIGMEMEMVVEKLKTDKEGNEVYTYKFRPVKADERQK